MTRVSRFYSYTPDYILDLPLKTFTLYNSNISRLRAEEDMRLLTVLAASNSGEVMKSVYDKLKEEQGKPIIIEEGVDLDGLEKLKVLSERMNGGSD